MDERSVLSEARIYAQKGPLQKALQLYDQLLQVNPQDTRMRVEVGDIYRRLGLFAEAIAQYHKAAEQFSKSGFDFRSVAVLKQILAHDPHYHPANLMLAQCYKRMGLGSEASATLESAADACFESLASNFDEESTLALTSVARCFLESDLEIWGATHDRFLHAAEKLERAGKHSQAAEIRTSLSALTVTSERSAAWPNSPPPKPMRHRWRR